MRPGSLLLVLLLVAACGDGAIRQERLPRTVESDKVMWVETPKLGMLVREAERELPPSECELGESKPCWDRSKGEIGISADGSDQLRFRKVCVAGADGVRRFNRAACNTPLVVSFEENEPVTFTSAAVGREFMIGASSRTEWVSAKTPWLGRDLNGDGCISDQSELFGPPPTKDGRDDDGGGHTGFDKLRELDDNGDGVIDSRDAGFESLLLWSDKNQDKTCTATEVMTLREAGIESLSLKYTRKPSDDLRSYEGESAELRQSNGKRGRVIDVYLAPAR